MAATAEQLEEPPVGRVTITYLGPVAPHWAIEPLYGEPEIMDAFGDRARARLLLLPPHDPQFGRNRLRVVRDAERENIDVVWELGEDLDDEDSDDDDDGLDATSAEAADDNDSDNNDDAMTAEVADDNDDDATTTEADDDNDDATDNDGFDGTTAEAGDETSDDDTST